MLLENKGAVIDGAGVLSVARLLVLLPAHAPRASCTDGVRRAFAACAPFCTIRWRDERLRREPDRTRLLRLAKDGTDES
jgi:hypothetical protein